MPYLKLTEAPIRHLVSQDPHKGTLWTLEFDAHSLHHLIAELKEIFGGEGGELRTALPQQGLLFWKTREQGNRSLVAHPNPDEWVGTLALEVEFGMKLIRALTEMKPGESVLLSQFGPLETVSNLELVIVLY